MSNVATGFRSNRLAAVGLVAVAVICAALAVFYMTVKSTFLASHYGHQPKHALLFAGLAVIALIAASIVWRRRPA
jgi:flagellar biosynthesis/type III secretory pathway M-ring protein FliF/YscJ